MSRNSIKTLMSTGALIALSSTAYAGMGNAPSNVGLLPGDVASAQAMSIFNSQASAVYYNPAALVYDSRGEMTAGLMHVRHDLNYTDGTGNGPSSGTVQDDPSQQIMLGLKTNISSMTTINHPIYVALMVSSEKFGREMLAFNSKTSGEPQYLEYSRHPLFLTVGGATQLWRGINLGASVQVNLSNSATLDTGLVLNGQTYHENLDISAENKYRPIVGLTINWGDTFCSGSCWLQNLDTAVSYRGYSYTQTSVAANTTNYQLAFIPLEINSVIDAYQPDTYSVGVRYNFGRMRVAVTGEYQTWSDLTHRLEHDTIKDQAVTAGNLDFKDIVVPRLGVEYDLTKNFTLVSGVAWEPSALDGDRSKDVNYIGADRWVFGLGFRATVEHPIVLAHPLTIGFGWQHQELDSETYNLSYTDPQTGATNAPRKVTTDGSSDAFVGSITLKF